MLNAQCEMKELHRSDIFIVNRMTAGTLSPPPDKNSYTIEGLMGRGGGGAERIARWSHCTIFDMRRES